MSIPLGGTTITLTGDFFISSTATTATPKGNIVWWATQSGVKTTIAATNTAYISPLSQWTQNSIIMKTPVGQGQKVALNITSNVPFSSRYFKVYFDDCSALANLTVLNGPLTTKLRKDREVVMKFISETPDVTKANKKVIKKFNKQLKEFTQTVEKTMSNCVRMIQICDRILA